MAENTSRHQFNTPLFREVHKSTWLKRVHSADSKKKKELAWIVFCVHDDTEPYLESYADNKAAILHKPDWFASLTNTQHISPTIYPHDEEYEFVITLSTEVIRLAASSWDLMSDWVESLRAKLYDLRILSPKENLYTKLPEAKPILLPTRDPTSPLPPPPLLHPVNVPGVETSQPHSPSLTTHARRLPLLQRGISQPETSSEPSPRIETNTSNNITIIQVEPNVFNFEELNTTLPSVSPDGATPLERNDYELLFQGPGPSSRNCTHPPAPSSPRPLQTAPQPYVTLRERQVLQLQKEMKHPSGVRLQLRRKDCISSIALVDSFSSVWIAGWKQKDHPMLYNALHIGDQLLSIEGISVKNAADAHKILRSPYFGLYINLLVKRVPFGQVFVIHRESEGQPLGIVQDGNTAIIQTVQANSLAARHGLTARTKTCDNMSITNWVLTEINGRPLNLFFKENQVRDRLNSVGRDISILVQPLDLIKQLKKQLKSLRNYKDYILQ